MSTSRFHPHPRRNQPALRRGLRCLGLGMALAGLTECSSGGSGGGSATSSPAVESGTTSSTTSTSSAYGGSTSVTVGGTSSPLSGGTATGSSSEVAGSSSSTGGVAPDASMGSGEGGAAGCPAGAVFCDDFEASSALGAAWTTDNILGATIGVVSTYTVTPGPTMAHSGKNSVHIGFTTGSGYAMIVEKMGFPAPTGYWGRVWLYIEIPAGDTGHDVYIEGSTGMNLSNYGVRPLNTNKGDMTINIDPVGTGEGGANTTTPIPRGAWTCFEWQISATGGTGDVVLYAGGATAATATLKSEPIPALVEQRVGYERYGAGTAGDLWIDDYAIGSTRLGCM